MEENGKKNKSTWTYSLKMMDYRTCSMERLHSRFRPAIDWIDNTQRFKMPLVRAQKDQLRKQQKIADRPAAMVVQAGEKIPISVRPRRPAAAATPKS
jgi:hypothetical protein